MSELRYELLKDFIDPCGAVRKGVAKTEHQWMARFALLNPGDCEIKTDWFRIIGERYPMCRDQDAQIDCRLVPCRFHDCNGNCTNISPAITLHPDGKWNCHSEHTYK